MDSGITINRPPRDGNMAFRALAGRHFDRDFAEGDRLAPQEPWLSMENTGSW